MLYETKKSTVPIPSVGADGERSIPENCTKSIANSHEEINLSDAICEESLDEILDRLNRQMDPNRLRTVTMNDLYDAVYRGKPPIIDGLLYPGTYLFAGAPKVGKSFFMAQLAYHVSTGLKLWDYDVKQGTVLYLALEDDYQRLQERMFRMFGIEGSDCLYFAVVAKQLGQGLDQQLTNFMQEHPDTKLIIVDTLQKVREIGGESYSYANDYDIVGQMKRFADQNGICMLLVHHTRKQTAGDKFEMISGTNGLLGCADGAFLMHKEKRTDMSATLDIVGRDQPDQKLFLIRDPERLVWNLDHAEAEKHEKKPDPLLGKIAAILSDRQPTWEGSATDLTGLIDEEILPNRLTRKLNVLSSELLDTYGILYTVKRTSYGSWIRLKRQNP